MQFLNALEDGNNATTKITIHNHRIDKLRFEDDVLLAMQQDSLDNYRQELNSILLDKLSITGGIAQDKYITITTPRRDPEEARSFFQRMGNEMSRQFDRMGSTITPLDAHERLRILHDFFRPGDELFFDFNLQTSAKRGHDWKDYICPDGMEIKPDHIKMGDKYVRTLFLQEYATTLREDLIADLSGFNRDMVLSIDLLPVLREEAVQAGQRILLGQTTNAAKYNKRQVNNNTFMDIPFELQQQISETKELLEDLTQRDQRMFFVLVTLAHIADSKEELDADTETLMAITRRHSCRFGKPYFRQEDTLNTVLPYGARRITGERTMTTESAGAFIPFNMQAMADPDGAYYGQNAISKLLLLCNRKLLQNGNGFVTGVPGSGKSLISKEEIIWILLNTKDDIIIFDPEGEYGPLVKALGGEVIRLAPSSPTHINAMDMSAEYGEESSLEEKADFVLSLCEEILGAGAITIREKSIIDRCIRKVYRSYIQNGYSGVAPTLSDLSDELNRQPEEEAKDIVIALELYTKGSMNTFAQQTNVDLNNRLLCFDIKDLGKQLKTFGLLVTLDAVVNRMSRNQRLKKHTWLYIDEIYLLFANEYSRQYLFWLWKRVRKLGGLCTGITQNVGDMLRYDDARTMLSNSEFLIMMNQAPTDRMDLTELYQLSTIQQEYITNAGVGRGLIRCGKTFLPFENEFPRNTELYKLMTSKLEERL